MMNLSPWTKEDLQNYQNLDDCLSKMANWQGSTPDMIKLYRCLVWYAGLKDKIQKSTVGDMKVHEPKAAKKAEEKAE